MNNEDFIFYGISPHYDPFRIVNCHVCNKIISLTFFHDHLVKKHDLKMCLANSCSKNSNNNENNTNSEEEIIKIVDEDDEVASINENQHQNHGKSTAAIVSTTITTNGINHNNGNNSSSSSKTTSTNKKTSGIVTPKSSQTITPSPSTSTTSTSIDSASANNNSKKYISKANSKIYDPDRHCGVLLDDHKPCTRSLTCKKHPINMKRQVKGRSKSFNDLFKRFRDEKIQHNNTNNSIEVKLEDIKCAPPPATTVGVLPPPTPPPSTSQKLFDLEFDKSESLDSPSPSPPAFIEETSHQQQYIVNDDDDDADRLYYQLQRRPQPVSVCTYGARYLDTDSSYLVWNHKEDNLRSMLSSAFNEYLTSSSSTTPSSIQQVTQQQSTNKVRTKTAPLPSTTTNLKPIVITLPSIKVEDTFKQQQKIPIKRSNSLTNSSAAPKVNKISPKPIILTKTAQNKTNPAPLATTTATAFILPTKQQQATPIKYIQASSLTSASPPAPVIHTNGVKRGLTTKKLPQTIIPKTALQSPTITKTTKLSPKPTSEYIILNGNCLNTTTTTTTTQQHQVVNGGINKLTLISTPTTAAVSTPTKSINLIQQSPSTIKITKRCIDTLTSPSSSDTNYTTTTTTTFNHHHHHHHNSPKYIKLSHNSSGVLTTTTTNNSCSLSPSTLILTPIATTTTSSSTSPSPMINNNTNNSATVLKTPIAKLKIPISTNIRNK